MKKAEQSRASAHQRFGSGTVRTVSAADAATKGRA